jgi:hypothetical protein
MQRVLMQRVLMQRHSPKLLCLYLIRSPAIHWRMSLKEQVRPGQSRRTQFLLVSSKLTLLLIDVQEYLSRPITKQDEQEHKSMPTSTARRCPELFVT